MTTDAPQDRLSLATLAGAQPPGEAVDRPAVDPRSTTVGIVHLGVGAFHRAHQAVYTEDAAARTGETGWGILGVTQRSARVVDQLRPQDGLYGVLSKGRTTTSLRVVGVVRDVAFQGTESARVLDGIAAPTTHIVSSTVSEKGYRRSASGGVDLGDPDLAADVAALGEELGSSRGASSSAARTPIGALVRGLARRHRDHGAPLTMLCCDNLAENGRVVEGLVHEVIGAVPGREAETLRGWVAESVRFPMTMVDRITPSTTDAHRAEAAALLGLRDEALVVAEPFRQWVIEDAFAGPRPRWELAGATVTADVAPFERAKLRMLNASHSAIAYLGGLRGHRTIDGAMGDPAVVELARRLMDEDVIPTLTTPEGVDLHRYRDEILERFANPSTGYTTAQVATDGSAKIPIRILGTVAERLAAGATPSAAIRTLAAWIVYVAQGRDVHGTELALDDPLAERLRRVVGDGPEDGLADRMLEVREVFPGGLADDSGFRAALRGEVADLLRQVPTR